MRTMSILLLTVLCLGCAVSEAGQRELPAFEPVASTPGGTVYRWTDPETGVVCYTRGAINGGTGLSCVQFEPPGGAAPR